MAVGDKQLQVVEVEAEVEVDFVEGVAAEEVVDFVEEVVQEEVEVEVVVVVVASEAEGDFRTSMCNISSAPPLLLSFHNQ